MCWRWTCALSVLLPLSAFATSISVRPLPAIRLSTGEFLALDTPDSVTLFDANGVSVRRFVANTVASIAVSPDERLLAMGCWKGEVALFDLVTGKPIFSKSPFGPGFGLGGDVCFAANGKSFVVCGESEAVVLDSSSGNQLGIVRFPPRQTRIMSAALSPDGSRGALIDLGERVFVFETATGKMQDTGLKGACPIRYSSDGKYFACRNLNSGVSERLRVINSADVGQSVEVGQYAQIGHIKPTVDGKFLITALIARDGSPMAGAICDPATSEFTELWTVPPSDSIPIAQETTDFDPATLIGVSTTFNLVTTIADLKNRTTLLTIDNSSNFRASALRTPKVLIIEPLIVLLAGVAIVIAGIRLFRRERSDSAVD